VLHIPGRRGNLPAALPSFFMTDDRDHLLRLTFDEVFDVEPNYAGWRLDQFLTQKLHRASRSQVARILQVTGATIDHRPARPASRLRPGEVVRIRRTERIDPATPALTSVQILLDEPPILVLNKPPGMLVHRNAGEVSRTIDAWLEQQVRQAPLQGRAQVALDSVPRRGGIAEPVHRLDRETSGCLVCARGLDEIRRMRERFERTQVQKTYAALVHDPHRFWHPGQRQVFDTPLGFDTASKVKLRVGPGDAACSTTAVCAGRREDTAALHIQMEQGRQHQIRAHLGLAGTPIVGDKLYGMGDDWFLDWLERPGHPELVAELPTRWHCLHAWQVSFTSANQLLSIHAPLPEHMLDISRPEWFNNSLFQDNTT
jgi:23S rRNA pseudouridine1911/1915/1917 synthase